MNNFERELRKIVGYCEYIRNPKYVGRSCIGRLDDDIVVKMEFESTMIRDKYNALRVTLMNRSEGKIDTQLIRFNELWGVKHISGNDIEPHIWKYNEDVNWYCYIPTSTEMSELSQSVDEYLSCFTEPEMEETEEMEMSM
ncbi:MAG: hypothetical protein IJN05_11780 [Ruminococcus sp.]|nr:hypothetical protein [Ruminococcus sp.]